MTKLPVRQILRRRSRSEWAVFGVLLTGSLLLGHTLSSSTVWIDARGVIYQLLTTLGRDPNVPSRTAIVLLDDTDYWLETPHTPPLPQLAGRAPTSRTYLANLVDVLSKAHVKQIVLDFDLRSPSPNLPSYDLSEYAAEDETLFTAIRNACAQGSQVILASEIVDGPNGPSEAQNIYDSANFSNPCVYKGYIELPQDIRRVPVAVAIGDEPALNSLSLATVQAADGKAYAHATSPGDKDFPYSQFMPLSSFSKTGAQKMLFSGRDIELGDPATLALQLQKRIVLIGADWHTLAFAQGSFADRHPTPAHDLPGVVLHANYIEAALQKKGINQAFPERLSIVLEVLLVLCLSLLGMLDIHWAWKWGAVLISSIAVVAFSYLLLRRFGLMLDFFFPLIFLGVHSGYEHFEEWRHGVEKE